MKSKKLETVLLLVISMILLSWGEVPQDGKQLKSTTNEYCYYTEGRTDCIRNGPGAICGLWSPTLGCVPF